MAIQCDTLIWQTPCSSVNIPNTSNSKTPTTSIHFQTNYNYGADFELIKSYFHATPSTILHFDLETFLPQCMICKLTHFDIAWHNKLHICCFSDIPINLLGSAPCTALHFYSTRVEIPWNTNHTKTRAEAWLLQQLHFYLTLAFVKAIG